MILSVSRRTDIPSYYSDWFLRRIREGFLYVRNPFNPHQISRIDQRYTKEYHLKAFEQIAASFSDYTEKVVISFVDLYAKTKRNAEVKEVPEQIDLSKFGIEHGHCIDVELMERLIGCKLQGSKDKNQRKECVSLYRPESPLLCGTVGTDGKVTESKAMEKNWEETCK